MKELDTEEIERYLRRELSLEDKAAFEAEMGKDPALAEEVELRRAANDLSFIMLEDSIREKMRGWETTPPLSQGNKRRFWLVWLLGSLLVGIACWWMYGKFTEETPQKFPIAVKPVLENETESMAPPDTAQKAPPSQASNPEKVQKDTAIAAARESNARRAFPKRQRLQALFSDEMGSHSNDVFQKGIDWIRQENFSDASSFFQQMEATGKLKDNSRGYLLYGYSCFFNRDYPGAERCFRQTLAATPIFKNEAEWMLCLTLYAQHGSKNNAFLSEILKDVEHPFWKDAQTLRKRGALLGDKMNDQ